MIELVKLSKTFSTADGQVEALKDISLRIEDGDVFGIIGLSGAGKSTLVRCINLLERPTEGQILVDGRDLTALSPRELRKARKSIGMIFQGFHLLMQRTALENVCFPLELAGVKRAEARRRAQELLELVELPDKAGAYPVQLSGGQKQRVAIAGILAMKPRCIVLDEPTAMLDPVGRGEVLDTITRLNRQEGITVILVTHHMEECIGADRLVIMSGGSILMDGSPKEIFPRVEEMEAASLGVPDTTRLLYALNRQGCSLPLEAITTEECAQALMRVFGHKE